MGWFEQRRSLEDIKNMTNRLVNGIMKMNIFSRLITRLYKRCVKSGLDPFASFAFAALASFAFFALPSLMGEYAVSDKDIHIEGTLVRADGEMFFPLSDGRLIDMSKTLYKFFGKMDKLMKNQ